jgi:AP2-associated kinase
MSRGQGQAPGKLIGKSLYVGNYYVTVQKKLGEGGFADIYQCVNRADHNSWYALKHFRIDGDAEKLASVKRECLLMKDIKKHPNIVTLYAACFAGQPVATDGFFLVCTYLDTGHIGSCGAFGVG